eukprot:TRINITY_DN22554_c0_g1_i1.p1 TRINITY_DN22554_c0_g1~~TRINITY_DN22554_c0_g1_i1.p1  ORF type:complete len:376 (-),score=54.78 TRINITY_DN22554_c0_g1_i1:272-1366(-)
MDERAQDTARDIRARSEATCLFSFATQTRLRRLERKPLQFLQLMLRDEVHRRRDAYLLAVREGERTASAQSLLKALGIREEAATKFWSLLRQLNLRLAVTPVDLVERAIDWLGLINPFGPATPEGPIPFRATSDRNCLYLRVELDRDAHPVLNALCFKEALQRAKAKLCEMCPGDQHLFHGTVGGSVDDLLNAATVDRNPEAHDFGFTGIYLTPDASVAMEFAVTRAAFQLASSTVNPVVLAWPVTDELKARCHSVDEEALQPFDKEDHRYELWQRATADWPHWERFVKACRHYKLTCAQRFAVLSGTLADPDAIADTDGDLGVPPSRDKLSRQQIAIIDRDLANRVLNLRSVVPVVVELNWVP